jgi:Domain of unknown function (DUF6457)
LPNAIRSSHHASALHARSASVVAPNRASGFGDPKRRLAPPTSRMPVMDPWLSEARDRIAERAGIAPAELELEADTEATLLDLARVAAHESGARTNAPLLCYLAGRVADRVDADEVGRLLRPRS